MADSWNWSTSRRQRRPVGGTEHSPISRLEQHFGCVSWTSVIAVPQTLWMHSQKALSSALLGGHGSQNRPLISRVGIPWLLPRLPPEQPTPCHKLLRL
ncbi:hypothetical protein F751_2659 [Auxenochlorella protothecoides]|uniref:Uncharacterized protein n=1 Tax=Auxenochlorella protothecoides TaxID=3075 RepID=A0A087SL37_AUXPR|nr:hypothetical protein F751_2659 [Auxenochlorella protothecoides]KFM26441.1 hypothetical protein F751_2659 [Auxenochlorella protothecoides]